MTIGICPKDSTYHSTDTCSTMFIITLLTIARKSKQLKCPSTDEWIMKIVFLFSMECYLSVTKYETMKFMIKWIDQ